MQNCLQYIGKWLWLACKFRISLSFIETGIAKIRVIKIVCFPYTLSVPSVIIRNLNLLTKGWGERPCCNTDHSRIFNHSLTVQRKVKIWWESMLSWCWVSLLVRMGLVELNNPCIQVWRQRLHIWLQFPLKPGMNDLWNLDLVNHQAIK